MQSLQSPGQPESLRLTRAPASAGHRRSRSATALALAICIVADPQQRIQLSRQRRNRRSACSSGSGSAAARSTHSGNAAARRCTTHVVDGTADATAKMQAALGFRTRMRRSRNHRPLNDEYMSIIIIIRWIMDHGLRWTFDAISAPARIPPERMPRKKRDVS